MSHATLLSGKALAQALLTPQHNRAQALHQRLGRPPGLAVVRIGDDAASAIYVGKKVRRAAAVGLHSTVEELPASTTQAAACATLCRLNAAAAVDAVLLQLPLPPHLDAADLLRRIDPRKDVDGLHPQNLAALLAGQQGIRPCTPRAVMHLLRAAGRRLAGCRAVVVGRSAIVGRPLSLMLLQEDATVTICHSQTVDLPGVLRHADVVVAAVGRPRLIAGSWLPAGATVIDVGINRLPEGLCGDVDFAAALPHVGHITPVPGGVGPLTVAMLVDNALELAAAAASRRSAA